MSRSRQALGFVALAIGLSVSACGFQPLYGTSPTGSNVATELSAVAIDQQDTRLGQLIRNDLLSTMSGTAAGATRYRLQLMALDGTKTMIENDHNDNEDTRRFNYRVNVAYRLIDRHTGQELNSGKTFSQVSYDRTTSDFSNVQAESNAMERAAKEVGNDIRTRLAAYFAAS
jgi:LPS-assembly lipoprotein